MIAELERYEKAMQDANMTPETIQSYVDRAHRFVGWLDGDYKPSEHFDRPRYRYPEHRAHLSPAPATWLKNSTLLGVRVTEEFYRRYTRSP